MAEAWETVIKVVADKVGAVASLPRFHLFSITLIGDAILGGDDEEPRLGVVAKDLGAQPWLDQVQILASFLDPGWRRGFHDLHRVRKPHELVCTAGSTMLFGLPEQACSLGDLHACLAEVERIGIGRRRAEGFGEVAVCHPFHSERALEVI
jgi:CRISPR-associated protein Csx10